MCVCVYIHTLYMSVNMLYVSICMVYVSIVYVYIYLYVNICVYICIYIYTFIFIYICVYSLIFCFTYISGIVTLRTVYRKCFISDSRIGVYIHTHTWIYVYIYTPSVLVIYQLVIYQCLPQNSVAESKKRPLSQSFYRTGVLRWLRWVLLAPYLSWGCSQAVFQECESPHGSNRAREFLPNSLPWLRADHSS